MPPLDPATSERFEGPTPMGGVAAVAYWRDAAGNPTTKDKAVAAELHDLDAAGNSILRTYVVIKGKPPGA